MVLYLTTCIATTSYISIYMYLPFWNHFREGMVEPPAFLYGLQRKSADRLSDSESLNSSVKMNGLDELYPYFLISIDEDYEVGAFATTSWLVNRLLSKLQLSCFHNWFYLNKSFAFLFRFQF